LALISTVAKIDHQTDCAAADRLRLKRRKDLKRILLLLILLFLIITFFSLELHHWLSFDALKQYQARFDLLLQRDPWLVAGGFFALYVLVTALSLPGAAIMTLAAGALFGLIYGTVLVSFASTIGATLAFLAARFLLRDGVQRRFGDKLKLIDQGIERDGPFYLFTLRMVPLFPFFLINLLMGLTQMRVVTFYWVSQVGMLAGTVVYVNAGTQLAQLDTPSEILSLPVALSFALLGLFPWLARGAMLRFQRQRPLARWSRPKQFDRNLVIIGAGAAGLVSAYIAATVKAKVTLVEARKMGGDCLNTGCVPSKALIQSASLAYRMRHADNYGLGATEPQFNFRQLMRRVNEVVARIAPHDSVARYQSLGVEVVQGHARLIDPWSVEINGSDGHRQRITTRAVIIAAGAQPIVPALPGIDEVGYLTSETLWQALAEMDQPPARLVVLGGGPIGCELAQAMARLGSQVILIQRGPRLLPNEDEAVSALVQKAMGESGVSLLLDHEAVRCEMDGARRWLVVRQNGLEQRIEFDTLLCAVGRVPRLEGYGLETLGIETERTVLTNDYLETLYPHILAAGDVAGPYQFTHTAAHQAWYATVNALFGQWWRFRIDYSVIPRCTFTDPEVARVGLNEQEARAQGIAYDLTRYELAELDRAIVDGTNQGFIQVLTMPGKDRILGVTIVAAQAGELLAEFVLAMRHGLGMNKILATIHIYPTLAEANRYVAGEWRKTHAPRHLLAWVERYHRWRRRG
jgi:pyruvate/2-oxoglutarate dehydrogenase complex dihydrolipoamide dehydrogenase (E3) component/uncharacterized membrane protein YdjX (TVP38/TMEM64 family)